MTTTAPPRPYVSIYVAIDTPDAPRLDGKPVRSVSWSAYRFSRGGAQVEYTLTAHHSDTSLTTLGDGVDLPAILVDLPAWVPWPPANWLASLELDRDRIAAMCDAIDAEVYHPEHFGPGVWK